MPIALGSRRCRILRIAALALQAGRPVRAGWAVAVALTVAILTPAGAAPISGLKPADPQPVADKLAPGLAVQYTYAMMNHINELRGRKFEPGAPILQLDWHMGTGKVLTSKNNTGVGAILTGFIQFEKPGVWGMDVTSNDGVRVEIGGQLIHEDPGVHSDTTSDRIDLQIDRPGWYPITILYFQKRYTATLAVRWIAPGDKGNLEPIAPKALAHPKE